MALAETPDKAHALREYRSGSAGRAKGSSGLPRPTSAASSRGRCRARDVAQMIRRKLISRRGKRPVTDITHRDLVAVPGKFPFASKSRA